MSCNHELTDEDRLRAMQAFGEWWRKGRQPKVEMDEQLLSLFEQMPRRTLEELKEDLEAIGINTKEELAWVRKTVAKYGVKQKLA